MSEPTRTYAWGTMPEMFGPRHEHRLAMILEETARIPKGLRLLEAAIGLGQLASRLKQQGLKVFGIDGSLEAALYVCRQVGVPVVIGDLTKLPFRSGAFDAITSGETLEHIDDDRAAVRELSRVAAPGASCVVTVPALESLRTSSDTYYEHRRRYTRPQLTSMFREAGFRVHRATYWGFPVVLAYDTLFILPMNFRRRRKEVTTDAALRTVARAGKSRLLVKLVRSLFKVDRLFSAVPFGPGLLLVAKKAGEVPPSSP